MVFGKGSDHRTNKLILVVKYLEGKEIRKENIMTKENSKRKILVTALAGFTAAQGAAGNLSIVYAKGAQEDVSPKEETKQAQKDASKKEQ